MSLDLVYSLSVDFKQKYSDPVTSLSKLANKIKWLLYFLTLGLCFLHQNVTSVFMSFILKTLCL